MLLPYRTDAPVYHWPYATASVIVINLLVHTLCLTGHVEQQSLFLPFGSIDPLRWLSSIFTHADIFHLVFNLVVLWPFGLLVEGKVGALRFLGIYLGIGIAESVLEQLLMIGATEGGSLGASGAIFGLMGVAMIWSPRNHIDVLYWIWMSLAGIFTTTVRVAVGTIFAIQLVFQLLSSAEGQHMSSMLLHLIGAAAGLGVGAWMVRAGHVDCEGWDWFSLRDGRRAHQHRGRTADRARP